MAASQITNKPVLQKQNPTAELDPILSSKYTLLYKLLQFLQLALLWFVAFIFNLESDLLLHEFLLVVILVFGIHSLTPFRYKPIAFFIGFVLSLYLFIGFENASYLMIVGLGVLGICHLPLSMNIRRLLVLGVGFYFGAARFGYIWSPLSPQTITIFAAIFMFRVIIYLYELRFEKESVSVWHRLNYFFLLPNIIFPLFPIVDWKTYLNTYYDKPAVHIQQRGINLIVWSIVCLLIYRFIYYFAVPDIESIDTVKTVFQYMIASYLTVIRLIGILSLSVGIIRLFGYNLPDIFNYMFLASSYSDLFRRINIYWKSFMMKLCYFPVYFKLRKITPRNAIILSAIVTFFFTWFFHLYQWAWILGTNPIRTTSVLYWSLFGFFATMSMILENKKGKPAQSYFGNLLHGSKIVGVFLSMAALYSMWTNATLEGWYSIIQAAFNDSLQNWLEIIAWLTASIIIVGSSFYLYRNKFPSKKIDDSKPYRSLVTLLLLIVLFFTFLRDNTNSKIKIFTAGEELNINDANKEYEGYYEDILSIDISSQLWDNQIGSFLASKNWFKKLDIDPEVIKPNEEEWLGEKPVSFSEASFVIKTDNILKTAMNANVVSTFRGKKFSTNKWGMRDQNYEKKKNDKTVRIALLGGSPTIGTGINDNEVFEYITERMLNEKHSTDSTNYEILNFSLASGIQTFQLVYLLKEKVLEFDPDYVVLVEHFAYNHVFYRVRDLLNNEVPIYPELQELLNSKKIDKTTKLTSNQKNELDHYIREWAMYNFSGICKENEIEPILLYYPSIGGRNVYSDYQNRITEMGYTFFDLEDVYQNKSEQELQVSEFDKHPNAKAHQLVAKEFFDELEQLLQLK